MPYSTEPPAPRTVKEFDPDDQPREKAERYGCAALAVPDLWAIILRTGTPGNPITELCRNMMRSNGGKLHNLERRTRPELRAIKGIGLTKSIQIEAVLELMRRYAAEEPYIEEPITSSDAIFKRMRHVIGNLDHEEVHLLILNRRNIVTKDITLTSGTATASLFDVKRAIKHAILENAEGVILCHNHPSGNLQPSQPDRNITQELQKACRYMNIKMFDHVIITATGYFSFQDKGEM